MVLYKSRFTSLNIVSGVYKQFILLTTHYVNELLRCAVFRSSLDYLSKDNFLNHLFKRDWYLSCKI